MDQERPNDQGTIRGSDRERPRDPERPTDQEGPRDLKTKRPTGRETKGDRETKKDREKEGRPRETERPRDRERPREAERPRTTEKPRETERPLYKRKQILRPTDRPTDGRTGPKLRFRENWDFSTGPTSGCFLAGQEAALPSGANDHRVRISGQGPMCRANGHWCQELRHKGRTPIAVVVKHHSQPQEQRPSQ